MSIIIGADLVPTKTNSELFKQADILALLGQDLHSVLAQADFRIFNLEVPLTDVKEPIKKCGARMIAPESTIKGIKAIGVDVFTLANNHILDQGIAGLQNTCNLLRENNIDYCGVGKCSEDASKVYYFNFYEKRIGVYACAEHEFSIVEDEKPGANPFDPLFSSDHIRDAKENCDYLIVLYHGGKEHYRYPSPNLQKTCRKIVEWGADLVITQHSHCIGCQEIYNNSTIVYGQGNFIFDDSESEFWKTSLLVEITSDFQIRFIPLIKNGNIVRKAKGKQAEEILTEFQRRSEQILDNEFVKNNYKRFAAQYREFYLLKLSGINQKLVFKALNRITHGKWKSRYVKKRFSENDLLAIRNYVECEAHRELLIQGVSIK